MTRQTTDWENIGNTLSYERVVSGIYKELPQPNTKTTQYKMGEKSSRHTLL